MNGDGLNRWRLSAYRTALHMPIMSVDTTPVARNQAIWGNITRIPSSNGPISI